MASPPLNMKEDKENTKPREKKAEVKYEERAERTEKKEKREALTKVVIRRLPPSLTKDQLEEQLSPLPEHDYFEFFSTNSSLFPHIFSRAYINFKNQEDIVLFRDQFDGYVFIDSKGQEFPAIVEFAPFQKIPKKKSKKKDAKAGTIEENTDSLHFSDDPEYKKFLESYNNMDDEKNANNPETLLEEIEAKTKELAAKKTTPLLDYVKTKQRIREEKREERRRRELEKRRLREEERRKWREDERRKRREAEKQKKMMVEKGFDKDKDRSKDEPKIKLLKKPEKGDDAGMEKPKDKIKKLERERVKEDRPFTGQGKRLESSIKEDKGKKFEDDGGRDYREKEERERERRLKEKERQKRQEEERRKPRERCEVDRPFRKKDEEIKKEKDQSNEKTRRKESLEIAPSYDKLERGREDKKDESSLKKERIRNKDRPTMQLYQPGARSRSRLVAFPKSSDSSVKSGEDSEEKKESEASGNIAEKESEE